MTAAIDRQPIDALVASFAVEHHCPTIAWGVVHDGRLSTWGSVGSVADGPVTEHTSYRIASMTKSFSAAATLWLRDAGVVRLDDPIGSHAPELHAVRSGTADAPPITIRDLLSMTSGLATDDPWADRHLDLTDAEFDSIVDSGPVFAVPTGIEFEYSNFGFALLGRIVERASGRRIQDVVSEELLAGVGMHETGWHQPTHSDWAAPFDAVDGTFVDELPPLGDGLIAPMGGIWTSVADLSKWVAWLDDAFPARDGPDEGPLSRSSRREMQTIQRYVGRRTLRGVTAATGYGYGLRILDEPAGRVVTHSGGLPGYGSNMRWLQGRRTGAVALANRTYAPMTELTARIVDLVVEQGLGSAGPVSVPVELRRLGEQLVAILNTDGEWDRDAVDAVFADNVVLDADLVRRRAAVTAIVGGTGPLTIDRITGVTDADATGHLHDSAGNRYTLTFSVAPVRPIGVQEYELLAVTNETSGTTG